MIKNLDFDKYQGALRSLERQIAAEYENDSLRILTAAEQYGYSCLTTDQALGILACMEFACYCKSPVQFA